MTKEELVRQAAKCLPSRVTTVKEEKVFIEGFVRGAEWMQAQVEEWLRKSGRGQMMGSLNRFLDNKVDVSK